MRYYYLNKYNEVQGSFSADEMRNLAAAGIINSSTLAAEEGCKQWRQLAYLKLVDDRIPYTPYRTEAAFRDGAPADITMLARCPQCGRSLCSNTKNLWENAVHAFKCYATFCGRAQRMEFWSFYLFSTLAQYALSLIFCFPLILLTASEEVAYAELLAMILSMLAALVFALPSLAVTVRRLHDTGHSGIWVVVAMLCWMLLIPVVYIAKSCAEQGSAELAALFALLVALAAIGISIFISVQMLLPSQPFPNKYGPLGLSHHMHH